jgi:6-pyruvoyltetrahydropterin/6-carboxytetrahydropterin synthase
VLFLTRKATFSAGHRYYLSDLSEEENHRLFGACARPHGHGHDYTVEVTLGGEVDPQNGMVVNISDLKPLLQREVLGPLDGQFLSPEHRLMEGRISCTEMLARWIWDRLGRAIAAERLPARLEQVRLHEYRRLWADCTRGEDGPVVTLTRTYEFAAAHRLNSDHLSPQANQELFGKCNNPHGHGHNYVLEVTVGGEPDPHTGFLIDLGLLDRVVKGQVVDRYDHRHLNLDIPEFRELIPTSENLVRVIWDRLAPALPGGALRRVTVRETDRNHFTYEGTSA